ncbi:acetyl-CoA sensor PanZ family protein [Halomonas sp. WWR20]
MPVTLQNVDHAQWAADAQIALDLSRIYHDASSERLPAAAEDFVRHHLEQGGTFCCAHFNDRRLGAVALRREGHVWWLSHFCVRATTRRRGVGSRLLALIADAARENDCVLRVPAEALMIGDQLLLSRLGYRLDARGTYFEFNPLAP